MSSEIKVGLLFFLAVGVALWFTLYVNQVGGGRGAYQVHFARVARLKEGDQVTYNGVRVGSISEVAPDIVDGKPLVRVSFGLDGKRKDKVLIDAQARYSIVQGLLGGSTLDIQSRAGAPITPEMLASFHPVGVDPVGIDEALASVRTLVEENRPGIKAAIGSIDSGMQRFGGAADEIRGVVAENRPGIRRAIDNLGSAGEAIAAVVRENRETIARAIAGFEKASTQIAAVVEENRPAIKLAIARLPEAIDNLSGASAQVRDAVAENRSTLKQTLENAAKFSVRLEQIGEDVKQITGQIASGRGTIGKLVFDDALHDTALRAVAGLEQRVEEVKPVTQGLGELKFYAGLDGGLDTTTGAGVAGAYLRIEPKPWKFYQGGVSYRTAPFNRDTARDDPEKLGADFNLLVGWRFLPDDDKQIYRLTVAGGLIDSKLGGLVQVPIWADRLSVTAMVRGKDYSRPQNDRRFEEGAIMVRAWGELRVWERVYLRAGGTDLASRHPGGWIGMRAELLDNDLRNITTVAGLAR